MKKFIWALLLFAGTAFAQTAGRYDTNAWTAASNFPIGAQAPIYTIPYATVTICTDSSCATPVSIYLDRGMTQPITQPFQADAYGKYGFWALPGTYWYTACSPAGDCDSGWLTVGSGASSGSSTCGSVAGDNTSTNCGYGNQVGNTGTSISTFGYTNVIGANGSNSDTAVGTNNINQDFGAENVAVGDSNLTSSTALPSGVLGYTYENVAIGKQNSTNYYGSTSICVGFANCQNVGSSGSTPNMAFNIMGLGWGAADNLGPGAFADIGIGNRALQMGTGFSGSIDEAFCLGDKACNSPLVTTGSISGINAIGNSALKGIAGNTYNVVAIGASAAIECTDVSCSPRPTATGFQDAVFVGDGTGTYNTGNYVAAFGTFALGGGSTSTLGLAYYNSGNYNTAGGFVSLAGNTTGVDNTALGAYAGCDGFVGTNPNPYLNCNHTGSDNTWLGFDSGPHSTTQVSNTFAVGSGATVSASNTGVLGNSSVTDVYFGAGTAITHSGGYMGPASAPSGACATNGEWVFSQDGHATFCSAGTWLTKI